jgi:hypothetical protein
MTPVRVPDLARQARPLTELILMGPPPGVSDDDCGTVQMLVTNEVLPRIGRAHYAYFRPTDEELAALNQGAYLELALYGAGVQPFGLVVQGLVPVETIAASAHARAVAPDEMWMRVSRERIAKERLRQIEEEGYTLEHDRKHPSVELVNAARAYATAGRDPESDWGSTPPACWPWGGIEWKSTGRIADLTKAGALYVAELDLQRLSGIFLEQVSSEFNQLVTDLARGLAEQW